MLMAKTSATTTQPETSLVTINRTIYCTFKFVFWAIAFNAITMLKALHTWPQKQLSKWTNQSQFHYNVEALYSWSCHKNELSGHISKNFTKLTSIRILTLSNKRFTGLYEALTLLQKCKNLTTLILWINFVGDEIPRNVSGFESLKVLALGNCALKGQIPDWLLNCRR